MAKDWSGQLKLVNFKCGVYRRSFDGVLDLIRRLEHSVIKLEEEPTGPLDVPELDVQEVTVMLRGLVGNCEDPKKLRTFMGSFVEKITVSGEEVAVHYNEGRMMSIGGSMVSSERKWLLDLGSNQGPTD